VTSSSPRSWLPVRRSKEEAAGTEPPFDASSWSGALIVVIGISAVLWVIQFLNAANNYSLDRFGLRPRRIDGLWGVVTEPFLHASYSHLFSNTVPFVAVGWVLLLSGCAPGSPSARSSSFSAAWRPGWWRRRASSWGPAR